MFSNAPSMQTQVKRKPHITAGLAASCIIRQVTLIRANHHAARQRNRESRSDLPDALARSGRKPFTAIVS